VSAFTERGVFNEAMRAAAVYHADEGTSGWLLSEAQFDAILAAADAYRADGLLSLAAELDGCAQAATAREQSERGHGHERAAVARGVLAAAYTDAARMARARAERDETATVGAPVADGEQAQSPGAPEGSPGRKHLDPCTRCNGSGSEPRAAS
jgi:hypothetical protein